MSIGVARGSPPSELAESLNEADSAMYTAKQPGGRSFVFAAPLIPSFQSR